MYKSPSTQYVYWNQLALSTIQRVYIINDMPMSISTLRLPIKWACRRMFVGPQASDHQGRVN